MNILDMDKQSIQVSTVNIMFHASAMFVRKGFKKAPFIDGVDDPKFRKTQVEITFSTEENSWTKTYLTFTKEWQQIAWPSLKAALPNMLDTSEIDGVWEIETVETGETYVSQDGTVKPRTTPRFIARIGDLPSPRGNYDQVPF